MKEPAAKIKIRVSLGGRVYAVGRDRSRTLLGEVERAAGRWVARPLGDEETPGLPSRDAAVQHVVTAWR